MRANSEEIEKIVLDDGKDFTTKTKSPMLTAKEREMLRNIAACGVKLTAVKMDIEKNYLYQRLYRLRRKLEKAQTFVNEINRIKKQSPRLKKFLTVVPDDNIDGPWFSLLTVK